MEITKTEVGCGSNEGTYLIPTSINNEFIFLLNMDYSGMGDLIKTYYGYFLIENNKKISIQDLTYSEAKELMEDGISYYVPLEVKKLMSLN